MKPSNEAHVYFWALPIGERFIHKGHSYIKTGEEHAQSLDGDFPSNGSDWLFEVHYGAIIAKERAKALHLPATAYRPL